jgi:hypothetical protein
MYNDWGEENKIAINQSRIYNDNEDLDTGYFMFIVKFKPEFIRDKKRNIFWNKYCS